MVPDKYADIKSLIFRGFLTSKITLNGTIFTLKTLNEVEHSRIREMIPDGKYDDRHADICYIAYSIYQIDGKSLIPSREDHINDIVSALQRWTRVTISFVVYKLIELRDRMVNALGKIEAFCYEPVSRAHWAAYKSLPLNSTNVTGIKGTELLGYNQAQIEWASFNQAEDEKNRFEVQWSYVRWVGAFINGKAAQEMDNTVQDQKRKEIQYRESVIKEALEEEPKRYDKDSTSNTPPKKLDPNSQEYLLKELEIVVGNEVDEHELTIFRIRDQIIDDYRSKREVMYNRTIENLKARRRAMEEGGDVIEYSQHPTEDLSAAYKPDLPTITRENAEGEVESELQRDILCKSYGIDPKVFEEIDLKYTVPKDLYAGDNGVSASSRVVVLPTEGPINSFNSPLRPQGNFTGMENITRGGIPLIRPGSSTVGDEVVNDIFKRRNDP